MAASCPLADFYCTLRALGRGDSIPAAPEALREAAQRLQDLTEYLPDSIPLRTPENTVLIVHRKNPRYRAHVARLLWRRLDPALTTLCFPEEVPSTLTNIGIELKPICGTRADSVQHSLEDLYRSAYPLFLTYVWPSHEQRIRTWIRNLGRELGPCEGEILAQVSRDLSLPLVDSSRVRIIVVGAGVPDGATTVRARNGLSILLQASQAADGKEGAFVLLRTYLTGCHSLSPETEKSALRLLEQAIMNTQADPKIIRELPQELLDYALERTITRACGWTSPRWKHSDTGALSGIHANWDAYLSGGLTLEAACRAMAAAAVGGQR